MQKETPLPILCALFHPFVARSILYTGMLSSLQKAGHEITVLVPTQKIEFYSHAYPDLTFKGVDLVSVNHGIIKKLRTLLEYSIYTNVKKFHAEEIFLKNKNYLAYVLRRLSMRFIGSSIHLQNFMRFVFRKITARMCTGFEAYMPTKRTLVLSGDIYNEYDVLLLMTAERKGFPTLGMIRSWDNNFSKTLLPHIPGMIITQNHIMEEDTRRIHGVRCPITSVGIPYYETYREYSPIPKNKFFEKIGIPHDAILILFAPAGNKFIDHDWHFCQILKEAIERGDLPSNLYVLVRCHPGNPCDLSSFEPNEHFIIEQPGIMMEPGRSKGNELDMSGIHHLIDSLTHSTLVINILSSMILDAAVVGTPIVTPAFEGRLTSIPFLKSVKRFQIEENMEKILSIWNGAQPRTEGEFILAIMKIVTGDTVSDMEAIMRIRESYCPHFSESPTTILFETIHSYAHKNDMSTILK